MSLPALPQATTTTPDPGALVRWIHVLIPASQLAERIASTEFVPVAMRNKPEVVTAAIMYGDELGIGPMQALASIHVIEGRPGPSAELMRALILRGGHSLAVHQATGSVCRVSGLRAGRPEGERYHLEWNIDMARAAGLVNKAVWQRYPRGMLLARATSELGRTVFPDAIKGMGYVADDEATAAEFDSWAAGYDDSTDTVPAPEPPPAVRRKPRKKVPPATVEEVLPEHAPAGAPEPEFDPRPPVAPAAEPAPGEAMVGASTRAAILATYATIRDLPDDSRETRLQMFSAIVGRPVESTNALTRHEAFRLLRILTDLQTGAARFDTDADGKFRVWPAGEPPDVPWGQPPLVEDQAMRGQPFGRAIVLRGDARSLPLAAGTVDLVVTSPPYFALRSYQDGGEHYAGQVGSEPAPDDFVDALLEATVECMRVLKPSGSLWVNLGDKYSGPHNPRNNKGGGDVHWSQRKADRLATGYRRLTYGVRGKSLIGIPWRYALRCIDDLGLILRAEVIWSKPNGLPESVTDRVRRSHEQWFHFTMRPQYYSAVDEIREAHDQSRTPGLTYEQRRAGHGRTYGEHGPGGLTSGGFGMAPNPLGKLPGSVWTIATQPLQVPAELGVDHFAAFPMEWPRRIIQGWSPSGVCTACGDGRRPVIHRATTGHDNNPHRGGLMVNGMGAAWRAMKALEPDHITGYECACPEPTAPTTPAVVLDPFGGTGTTALMAKALGRVGISVDMSADYCRLAQWRTTDEGELARALEVPKPPVQIAGQLTIFDALEG